MNVKIVKDADESIKMFQNQEWALADTAYFGQPVDWDSYDGYFIKAMDGDQIVGVLDMVIAHGIAKIKDIIVHHSQRRHGIGKKLMQEAEQLARRAGAHKMFLETISDWDARKFYESLGYGLEGTLPDHSFHKDFVYFGKMID